MSPVRDRKRKAGIKADAGSQRPGGKGGLKGALRTGVTIWTGCFEEQESPLTKDNRKDCQRALTVKLSGDVNVSIKVLITYSTVTSMGL